MDHPMEYPMDRSMDLPIELLHGPPLIFKRKSPLLIRKFTGGQGMKNPDHYLLVTSLTVCLVYSGLLWDCTPIKMGRPQTRFEIQKI